MILRDHLSRIIRSIFPSAEERLTVRADWRTAVHDHKGEATKLIGAAVLSRKVSREAIGTFQKTIRAQSTPAVDVELEQLRRLRAWLMADDSRRAIDELLDQRENRHNRFP